MKILVLILAFIPLLLSINPCCSEGDNCKEETEVACLEHHSESKSKPEIPCSPFYSCGACLGFSNQTIEITFSDIYPVESISFNGFNPVFKNKGYKLLPLKPPQQI